MATFTVACVQYISAGIQENIARGLEACKQAKALGADLVLFPELWSIGYDKQYMYPTYALDRESDVIKQFQDQARESEIAIAYTYLAAGKHNPSNNIKQYAQILTYTAY